MNNNIALTNAIINNEVAEWYKLADECPHGLDKSTYDCADCRREAKIKINPEFNPSDDDSRPEVDYNEDHENNL